MAAPTVYKWSDANAPVLIASTTNKSKSFVELLKACLVTGYGSKTPPGLGYNLRYEAADGTAIALQSNNPLANGFFYQIATEDAYTQAAGGDITYARVDMYEHMQSATTGKVMGTLGALFRVAQTAGYPDAPVPWVVVADDRFFYIFIYSYSTFRTSLKPDMSAAWASSCGCAGDFVRLIDDPWSSLVWGYDYGSSNGNAFGQMTDYYSTHPGLSYLALKRKVGGAPGASACIVVSGGGPLATSVGSISPMGGYFNGSYLPAPYATKSPVIISRPSLHDIGSSPVMRGYLPGLWYPCHLTPFSNLTQVSVGGKDFLAVSVRVYSGLAGQVLISLADWRA